MFNKKLSDAEITVNLKRSNFGQSTATFLGYVVGRGIVAPINVKVEAVVNFHQTHSKKEVMSFLWDGGKILHTILSKPIY